MKIAITGSKTEERGAAKEVKDFITSIGNKDAAKEKDDDIVRASSSTNFLEVCKSSFNLGMLGSYPCAQIISSKIKNIILSDIRSNYDSAKFDTETYTYLGSILFSNITDIIGEYIENGRRSVDYNFNIKVLIDEFISNVLESLEYSIPMERIDEFIDEFVKNFS